MVKKGLILSFVLVIVFLQVISAYDTEIKIKTIPKYEVQISIMDYSSGGASVIKAFKETSDEYGDVSVSFSTRRFRGIPVKSDITFAISSSSTFDR